MPEVAIPLAGLAVTGGLGSVATAAAPGAITSYAMTAGAKDYGIFQTMSGAGTFSRPFNYIHSSRLFAGP